MLRRDDVGLGWKAMQVRYDHADYAGAIAGDTKTRRHEDTKKNIKLRALRVFVVKIT